MIRFDRHWRGYSDGETVVVTCSDCPWWRSLQLSQVQARLAGERHQVVAHGVDSRDASRARRLAATRRGNRGIAL